MNKIPFTSQNPYAFYAKNIDSYDTETNTREAKKGKKNKSFQRRFFFSSWLQMGNTCFGNSFDEASEFHRFDTRVLFAAARLCSHAMLSSAGAQSSRFGLFKTCTDKHTRTHTDKNGTRVIRKPKHKLQAYSYFKTAKYNWHHGKHMSFRIIDISQVPVQINKGIFVLGI